MDRPIEMRGVVLTGHGGLEMLEYRTDLPVPVPGPGEVLIGVSPANEQHGHQHADRLVFEDRHRGNRGDPHRP